ncbi:facilitated trehalose transporter Tret1-2 homolog [Neodiprion fabricii]|uniref:facilitated trehalose transporter Tret1-2 homolog n=1 Tax=Neodiprion fabricii TaxID=2872261 RepID=UPI001ED8D9C4|nr:facilitated trehalose transporter Tret1-2 homolog [Neodiprion fabricii]XP_046434927.1 facilitated trehalose transporter Tret1-2 homolog [Neodiprion fabricii]XP_046434937.1 facilitated trehalose transporter Tret1-2 homolog [Neodiprion fabricii]XP_046434946.1 facilitated trehalose transporter Tret1-2 homolog [Neodiprion fabricii]XP_046434956.1 facilitated trehalose transporter Tret1-2 homolog [Neodiprion fabricii]
MEKDPRKSIDSERNERLNAYSKGKARYLLRQTMTALGPILSTMAAGMTSGYSAVLLPQLTLNNSTDYNATSKSPTDYLNMKQLTVEGTEEVSWIAASAALSMAPGCWISGAMMEKFGRRTSLLLFSPVFFIGWLIVGLAPSLVWLLVGRVVIGFCTGIMGPLSPVFIAETSEPRLRGILLSGISLAIAVGILVSHIFGTWLHWRLSAIMCGVFPIFSLLLCLVAPESPTWLVKRGEHVKARKTWQYLRGDNYEHEFEALTYGSANNPEVNEAANGLDASMESKPLQDHAPTRGWKNDVISRSFLMPLFILNVFFFTSQFSGINAVAFYSVNMLAEVSGPENAYTATLVLDSIRLAFGAIACWLTKNYPRRSMTIISGLGSALSLLLLSGSLFTDLGKPWLPICCLFAYTCTSSIGLVPLPWLLCGELFGASVRGLGSGISSGFAFMCFFVVVKNAPSMMDILGPSWTFCFYGIIALSGTIFLIAFLPETKDKTLQEIEDRFAKPFNEKRNI